MRYLLLILLVTNAHAITSRECKYGVYKCGYKVSNALLFCKSMKGAVKTCVENNGTGLKSELQRKKTLRERSDLAKKRIKDFNCNTRAGIGVEICWAMKAGH